jgi:CheY-like chemotaxis protein
MHILFADDVLDTRQLFALSFQLNNHTVCVAENGLEAVQAVLREPFDVVVLDIEMPLLNGWDALWQIRALPQGQDVPVVMFTGYNSPEYVDRVQKAGANLLVSKPMLPAQLLNVLHEVVEQHQNFS